MKATSIAPAYARRQLPALLQLAAAHLREREDFEFLHSEPEDFSTHELAGFLEECAGRLARGDERDLRRLWCIFGVASTWDDAGGSSHLGQTVFNHIDSLSRPS